MKFEIVGYEQNRDIEYVYDSFGAIIETFPKEIHNFLLLQDEDGEELKLKVSNEYFEKVAPKKP